MNNLITRYNMLVFKISYTNTFVKILFFMNTVVRATTFHKYLHNFKNTIPGRNWGNRHTKKSDYTYTTK